jgi:hypothetical protein
MIGNLLRVLDMLPSNCIPNRGIAITSAQGVRRGVVISALSTGLQG